MPPLIEITFQNVKNSNITLTLGVYSTKDKAESKARAILLTLVNDFDQWKITK